MCSSDLKGKVVAELMPYSGGLKRNIVQCLDDFGIPLKLSHTVIDIDGKERVKGVTLARVDENRKPIPGTEEYIPCDTLLLSVGLVPENELTKGMGIDLMRATSGPKVNESMETSREGVFACGNVLHVHDLVDYVTQESEEAGKAAARYIKSGLKRGAAVEVEAAGGVRYTVPSSIQPENAEDKIVVRFRVGDVYKDSWISVYYDKERILHRKKRIMAPGEMEQVILKKEELQKRMGLKKITITIEEA